MVVALRIAPKIRYGFEQPYGYGYAQPCLVVMDDAIAPKNFSTVISLDSRRIKLPTGLYRDYHLGLRNSFWVETISGLQFPASVVLGGRRAAYIETDTVGIMRVLGADGFPGTPQRRQVQMTYLSSTAVFRIHCPMSAGRLRPRLMRRQPAPLQVVPPNNEQAPGIEQAPAVGDNPDDPIEL